MNSDSLFCFGHKKGKSMLKRTILNQITLSQRANRSRHSLLKDNILYRRFLSEERFTPITLFKRVTRAKERIPNHARWQCACAAPNGQIMLI